MISEFNETQRALEQWKRCIMVKSLIIHGNCYDENQYFELESSERYVYNDIFGLVETQRFKAIIALDSIHFISNHL